MKKSSYSYSIIFLFSLTLVSRILFFENKFIDYDSVNYAFGVIFYSIKNTRPHFPGYPLFVWLIRFVNYFVHHVHLSFEVVVVLFSFSGIVFTYLFLQKIFGKQTAMMLSAVIAFNPLVWYYGTVTEIYSFDLLFASFFGLLIISKPRRRIYGLPILLAFGGGVRISSAAFFLPVCFYILVKDWKQIRNRRDIVVAVIFALFAFSFWFIPMIINSGGIGAYFALITKDYPFHRSVLTKNLFNFIQFNLFLLVPFSILIIYYFLTKREERDFEETSEIKKLNFTELYLWTFPALIFFLFFHYSKGYILLLVPQLLLIAGKRFGGAFKNRALISAVIIFEILMFLFLPFIQPDVNIYFKPTKKSLTLLEIFKERLLSDNLMSYNHIKIKAKEAEDVDELIEIARKKYPDKNSFFFDPTTADLARIAQYYNRFAILVRMDVYDKKTLLNLTV